MPDISASLQNHATAAAIHRLWAHSVAVVNSVRVIGKDPVTNRRGDAEEFGSGAALRWGDHQFILTAKHILAGAGPCDLRIFWRPSGSMERRAPAELRRQDVVDATPITNENASIIRCEWEDLAIIDVVPDTEGQHVEFFDLGNNWIDPPEGERVHCFGFPSDSKIPWEKRMVGKKEERTLAIYPGVFDGKVMRSPSFPTSDFNPDIHYLIPFEDAARGKDPHGYSGAAAWSESNQRQIIWHPNFKFAGTCTHSYRNGSFERVIKASAVRHFVEESFGEGKLRPGQKTFV